MASDWFNQKKFGMFIHFGLYSILAGIWNSKKQGRNHYSEWIRYQGNWPDGIPAEEYNALAKQFNPLSFNAEEWVWEAKNAGMKYLVITSKHHDGFALYDSKYSNFTVTKATIFKRDILGEVFDACRKYDIIPCAYYSHWQDWESENLIRREKRKGIFISGRNGFSSKEVAFFSYQTSLDAPYFRDILKCLAMEPFRTGYSFTIRSIPMASVFRENALRMELKRLFSDMNADCVLLYAPTFYKKAISVCMEEKKNLIFLGDFQKGEFNDLNFSQMTTDNYYQGVAAVEKMHARYKAPCYTLYGHDPKDNYYMNEFANGAKAEAKRLGVKLNWCCAKCKDAIQTVKDKVDFCRSLLEQAQAKGWLETPLFDLMNDMDSFQAFREMGITKEICSLSPADSWYPAYAETLSKQMQCLWSEQPEQKKIRLRLEMKLCVQKTD